jgi:hypothetical protein
VAVAAGKIPMLDVQSSNIHSIGYDKASKELHIRFKASTSLYKYEQVPMFVWRKMLKSESKNEFLKQIIQPYFQYTIEK